MPSVNSEWPTEDVRSADQLLDAIARITGEIKSVAWRGQGCEEWTLRSLIDRGVPRPDPYADYLSQEYQLLSEFGRRARRFLGAYEQSFLRHVRNGDLFKALTVMRHYGGPTRLLDWTKSAYVAAYFAVIDQPGQDAAIWWYDRDVFYRHVEPACEASGVQRGPDGNVDLNESYASG